MKNWFARFIVAFVLSLAFAIFLVSMGSAFVILTQLSISLLGPSFGVYATAALVGSLLIAIVYACFGDNMS